MEAKRCLFLVFVQTSVDYFIAIFWLLWGLFDTHAHECQCDTHAYEYLFDTHAYECLTWCSYIWVPNLTLTFMSAYTADLRGVKLSTSSKSMRSQLTELSTSCCSRRNFSSIYTVTISCYFISLRVLGVQVTFKVLYCFLTVVYYTEFYAMLYIYMHDYLLT